MTLADATAESNNCAYTRTLMSLGPGHFGDDGAQRVIDMAGRLGIDSTKLSAVPSLTLGTSDTNVLDMAEAYSVFANEGVHRTPSFITKIVGPDGKMIYQADTSGTRVISEQNARTETQILTGVITNGTGTRAEHRPARGGQDGHDHRLHGRMVRRIHAAVHDRGVDGQLRGDERAEPDAQRRRHRGHRRLLPGADLGRVHVRAHRKDLPVMQFTPPDEKQWPAAQKIDEFGRSAGRPLAPRTRSTGPSTRHDRHRPAPVRSSTRRPSPRRPPRPTRPRPRRSRRARERRRARAPARRPGTRPRARPAAAPARDAAGAGRARGERAGAPHARRRSSTSSGRSATPCAPKRSGSTTKPRPLGARAAEVDQKLYSGTVTLAARAAGHAGRHRHAQAPPHRSRGPASSR